MIKKLILFFLCADLVFLSNRLLIQRDAAAYAFHSAGVPVKVALTRGPFTVYHFVPTAKQPRALLIFGSGDGGWGEWEDRVSSMLRAHGYEVVGIDSAAYAATDYDLATLQADESTISQHFLKPYGDRAPPFLVGGWSMGAAQAVAAAGGPHPPPKLAGVVIASALSRGRYGLRLEDRLNVLPTGPGTFAVDAFAPALQELPLVQWHGAEDTIDSRAWLKDLRDRHREYDLPNADHSYNNASNAFLGRFLGSVDWVLHSPPPDRELHARND
jgi:phosphatidylglycerol lysyltransferase